MVYIWFLGMDIITDEIYYLPFNFNILHTSSIYIYFMHHNFKIFFMSLVLKNKKFWLKKIKILVKKEKEKYL